MKITHYLYNAFVIESWDNKIAIDPWRHIYFLNLNSIIPKTEWDWITHIFVTHWDPDHYDYALSMARKTGAKVFCGGELISDFLSQGINNVFKIDIGKTLDLKDLKVKGLKARHGALSAKFWEGFAEINNFLQENFQSKQQIFIGSKKILEKIEGLPSHNHGTIKLFWWWIRLEKDAIPFARGSIGFKITIWDKTVVNLGDTLLQKDWVDLKPDVLMIPIGGSKIHNTMDEKEALDAVKIIKPRLVIPCHYNCPFILIKNANPANDKKFKMDVEKLGIECMIMWNWESIQIW